MTLIGALIEGVRFAADSPVEEARFEPSVPTRGTALFEAAGFSMQPRMWGLAVGDARCFDKSPV
jgi:hypothetical protein